MATCSHAILDKGVCTMCGTPALTVAPIVVQPASIGRAAEPVTTESILVNMGYERIEQRRLRMQRDMVTTYRSSGGKRKGYCPRYD